MEERYICQCGGILILDMNTPASQHSVPPCPAYIALCERYGAKYEGTQLRDGETLEVLEVRPASTES